MSQRLSAADAAWLHMDRPTNLMVINSVLLFDEPVDWGRMVTLMQERLIDHHPKFRQRVVESHLPSSPPHWEDDPDFSLEHHMHHLALPAPGDDGRLRELVADLMTMPLDRSRPLWHIYLVDGYRGGAALIFRLHHCIADGIALARLMLSLTDAGASDRDEPPPIGFTPGIARRMLRLTLTSARLAASPARQAKVANTIIREGSTALRLLLTPADTASALKGEPGISRRVAWTRPLSLPRIKAIAHAHEVTVNDVLMAGISGALRHYLKERGSPVGEIQAMVPFNLRPPDQPLPRDLGNRFGLVFLPLPVGTRGTHRRLIELHRRMQEIKDSRDAAVSYELLSLTGLAPEPLERRVVDLFSAKGSAVITNVPGPSHPVCLAGKPVRTVLVWAPTSGQIGVSISIFSYRGEVTVGLMVDAVLIPDAERLVDALELELDALATLTDRADDRSAMVPKQRA